VIGEYLSGFRVFVDGLVEETDHVISASSVEDLAASYEAAVVVKDRYEPSGAYKLQVALP